MTSERSQRHASRRSHQDVGREQRCAATSSWWIAVACTVSLGGCCKLGFDAGSESTSDKAPDKTERTSSVDDLNRVQPPHDRPWKRESEPQLAGCDATFDGLAAVQIDALEAAVIICRVNIQPGRRYDSELAHTAPDPSLAFTFGTRAARFADGGEDTPSATVSIGGVDIAKDEAMKVAVFDRDVGGRDTVGAIEIVWAGRFPVALRDPSFEGECRAMERVSFAKELSAKIAVLDRALTGAERACVPSRKHTHLGYPRTKMEEAFAAFDAVAAYTGWNAKELVTPRERFDTLEASCRTKIVAERSAAATALAGQTKATLGGDAPLTITLVKATCDAADRAAYGVNGRANCVVELELDDSKWPISMTPSHAVEGLTIALVRPDGEMEEAQPLGLLRDGKLDRRIDGTGKTERILVVPPKLTSIAPDTLLWFETDGTSALLNVK